MKCFLSLWCGDVYFSPLAFNCDGVCVKQALFFHVMEYRVKGTWTDGVAIAGEFIDHFCPIESLIFCSMIEDVYSDKSKQDMPFVHYIVYRYRNSI